MDTLSYRTLSARRSTVDRKWYVIDGTDVIVGRLASRVAMILRGKHKPYYTPHVDCGDHVIIINADRVRFTGKKREEKPYYRYTGYPGGKRVTTPAEMFRRTPERVVEHAVRGMLPKNRLGRQIFRKLHVYAGPEHPHAAQNPVELRQERKSISYV